MKKKILIDANFPTETRVVLLDKNNQIEDVEYSSIHKKQIKGNIYLAKVVLQQCQKRRGKGALWSVFLKIIQYQYLANEHLKYYNLHLGISNAEKTFTLFIRIFLQNLQCYRKTDCDDTHLPGAHIFLFSGHCGELKHFLADLHNYWAYFITSYLVCMRNMCLT